MPLTPTGIQALDALQDEVIRLRSRVEKLEDQNAKLIDALLKTWEMASTPVAVVDQFNPSQHYRTYENP